MTNFEYIKNQCQTQEAMAKFLDKYIGCTCCVHYTNHDCDFNRENCLNGVRQWLESEREETDND